MARSSSPSRFMHQPYEIALCGPQPPGYRASMEVPRVAVSVDLVILTVRASELSALVWRRDAEPHQGCWALPGGFVRLEEDLPATAARVLA